MASSALLFCLIDPAPHAITTTLLQVQQPARADYAVLLLIVIADFLYEGVKYHSSIIYLVHV